MSALILATGSNIGERLHYLKCAKEKLCEHFEFVAESQIYSSNAVGYLDQPGFYNQVLEFRLPESSPEATLEIILAVEKSLGRIRDIPQGPRTIDIDLLFYGLKSVITPLLQVPHPRLWERSFVVLPLKELPYFETLKKHFSFPKNFDVQARPLTAQDQMTRLS